jgi:hypothetical protein
MVSRGFGRSIVINHRHVLYVIDMRAGAKGNEATSGIETRNLGPARTWHDIFPTKVLFFTS